MSVIVTALGAATTTLGSYNIVKFMTKLAIQRARARRKQREVDAKLDSVVNSVNRLVSGDADPKRVMAAYETVKGYAEKAAKDVGQKTQ